MLASLHPYVAFLRAINVAGHVVVKMEDLKGAFEAAGCLNVRTYIQSGNVLFEAPKEGGAALRRKIHARLSGLLGGEQVVMYRTAAELQALIEADPFKKQRPGAEDKLYIAFLAQKPTAMPEFPLILAKDGLEAFGMKGLNVFIVSRKVKGRYGFPNNFIEKSFGAPATTRNWNTIAKIAEMGNSEILRSFVRHSRSRPA